MRQLGVKLWTTDFIKNPNFVMDLEKSVKEGQFAYVELFALPASFDMVKEKAKSLLGLPVIIHAPHIMQNFDPSLADELVHNQERFKDSQLFADLLGASIIVTHPGVRYDEHSLEENLRQFKIFNDARIAVENLPYHCSSSHKDLMGITASEIKTFIDEVHCQFCLDFSHAICATNSLKRDIYEALTEFKSLHPQMYHLCDGDAKSTVDAHLHYGEGNYDLRRLMVEFTTPDAYITMETGKGLPINVEPWANDAIYLEKLLG